MGLGLGRKDMNEAFVEDAVYNYNPDVEEMQLA